MAVFQKKTEIEEFRARHEMFSGKLTRYFLYLGFPRHLSRVKVLSPHLSYLICLLYSVFYVKSASVRLGISSSHSPCWTVLVVWLALVA